MRAFKRAAAFILVLAMLLSSADFMQIVEAATEGDNLKVENQFISYLIDKKTGRYGISTVEGAPGRDGDRMAPLLYKGEKPDTSFTTFRIDGEDYIFGNDYGFLGIQGGITKSPATQGGINTTVWRAGDVEIRQQLTIVSDSANPDVGNVKVAYTVVNTGKTGKSIGSRILFDTMLGENDGSPLIIPGIKEPIEYEAGFEGDKVPAFWQSADRDICPNVVSYGLISGWNNKAPDRMTAAHWNGIGATKWDYIPDSTVKFASVFNKYNKSDSAVALYWDPEFLEAGETRVYETFYGLGLFLSADGSTFLAAMSGPDKLEMKEDRTGYVQEDFEIALSIDNSLPTSVQMKNMNAVIELEGGLKLSPGQPKEIMLGTVERDSRAELTWKVQGELSQFFRIGQATIFLKSESLKETLTYSKYTILPGGTDKLPDIQYTEITPKNLYYQDTRKSFEINGTGFGMLKDRSRWELKLVKGGTNPTVYTINHKMINIIDDKKIQVILQDINDIGSYTVKLSHRDFQGCTFENGLNITDDTAYKNLKYGILAVTGEQGSSYKINVFEDEDSLKKFKGNDKILLVIRGDIQQKENQSYEAYPGSSDFVEMNGVLLYKSDVPVKISESNGSVKLIGSGDLSVSGSVTFWKWDFKIDFDKGTKYTLKLSDESDNLDNNKKIEIVFTGVGGTLKNMLSGFNLKFNNAYFYKDDQGNGLIFGGSLYLSLGSKKDEGDSNNNNNNNNNDNIISNKDKKDDSKDPFKIEIDVQKVAMGQKSDDSIGFKGIAAEATVGFPKGYFPPPVDIGAEANVKIDTLSDPGEFGIKLDIDLKVIKVKGEIEFVLIPYPIPDKLYFYMGSDVGVDIIPPIPVATLLGVGGGIDNIYNLVNMDASSPPFTVMLTASAEIAKILKMEDVTLSVSWQHAELKGDIGIKGYNIIKDAVIRIRWYTPFGFHASARLEAFDCIEGKVLLNIFKDDILGIASVRLFVPKKVPTVGGMTIAGAELGVDMKKLWAELTVIGITMGVKYVYGESIPDFYIGDGVQGTGELVAYMDGTKGLCTMNYKNEETGEEGVMIYGTNISLLGSSEKGKAYAKDRRYLAAASTDKRFMLMDMPAVMALNDSTYQLNVQNQEAALFEIEYEGAKPHVRVFRPDGSEYILIEDDIRGNMRYQTIGAGDSDSGRDEQKLWISAVNPQPGIWKIISDKPLKLARLYDVKMASEFTSLNSIKIDNSNIKIEWTGKYLDDAKINLFLLEEGSNEAGRLLESGIDAAMGSYTAALPEDVQTGRYVIRAELTKEDYGFTSKTTNAFDVTDLKAPDQPRNLKVVSAGNGCLKAEWDKGQDGKYPAQGYIITVFNEDGTNIPEFPEAYVSDRTETIIGGEVTQQDGTTVRIEPGKSYKVSVMAHREDELVPGEEIKKQHYSEPLMSDAVYLPVPQPPELKLLLKQGEDILPLNTGESNIDEYYSKGNEAVLSLEGDMQVSADIYLNDEPIYSSGAGDRHQIPLTLNEGENNVSIRAVNSAGDFTDKVIRIICDTIPPLLLIDSVEIQESDAGTTALLKGKCEPGCRLTINGEGVFADSEGLFEHTLILGSNMSMEVYAVAEDGIGNKTEYRSTVYNDILKTIQRIIITPSSPTIEVGDSMKLQLNAVDSEGKYLTVNPEQVKWSLMADTGTVTLDDNANVVGLKEGQAYIMAEYKVTDDFSHTDAIPLTVVESTREKSKAARKRLTGPSDVLSSIAAIEKGRKNIFAVRLIPGKETELNIDEFLSFGIPADSFDNAADIRFGRYDNQEELMRRFPGMRLLGPMFDISLNRDVKLGAPICLRFRYDPGQVTDIRRVAVYRFNEQQGIWEYIGGTIDSEKGIITVYLSSFSKYAVLENSSLRLMEDIDLTRWSRDAVYSLAHRNIAEGVKTGKGYYYKPENYITRAEFIKLLSAGFGTEDTASGNVQLPFTDKKDIPGWAIKYVEDAYANGWVKGRAVEGKTMLGANEKITREEAAAILGRMLGDPPRPKGIYFSDRDSVAKYALLYLDILADMGVLSGYDDNTFKPKNFITREEAAAMIDRYLKNR